MTTENYTLEQVSAIAEKVVRAAGKRLLWTFYGEMGAGKTTLIQAVCQQLNVTDSVSSPTFSLVNEYKTATGNTVYHFDFYRIKNIAEAYDMGYEDYFYSGNICLIEWPELIEELLDGEDVFTIRLSKVDELTRQIEIN